MREITEWNVYYNENILSTELVLGWVTAPPWVRARFPVVPYVLYCDLCETYAVIGLNVIG